MKLSDFDYHLPKELIATSPMSARDQSRLLVLDKLSGEIEHKHFFDLLDYLQPGDLLVANNSKVIPARLLGYKVSEQPRAKSRGPSATLRAGGKIEVFLSKPLSGSPLRKGREIEGTWECLIKGRVKAGVKIILSPSAPSTSSGQEGSGQVTKLQADIVEVVGEGISLVKFNLSGAEFMKEVERIGHVPLPPYIMKARQQNTIPLLRGVAVRPGCVDDKSEYQTIYADNKQKGSVAAPTAGLHFTPELLKKIKAKGVGVEYLTLHVGLGTFLPVKTETIEEHKIHSEYAEVSAELIKKIISTKKRGGRIIAVGTTTTRTLEFVFSSVIPAKAGIQSKSGKTLDPGLRRGDNNASGNFSGWIDIFIYPPYKFKVVDALVTNFHLPKSTLLMLVSALATKKHIDKTYQEAIKAKYRFYSYGDAMLIK